MPKSVAKFVKRFKTPALNAVVRWSGLLWLWRFTHRHHVIVLMIHGTMDADERSLWMPLRERVSPKQLEKVVRCLAPHYRFVPLDEAADIVKGEKASRRAIVVTFDDGYHNNITHALPVLQRYGIPASMFLPTGFIDSRQPFWYDRIDYDLQQANFRQFEYSLGSKKVVLRGETREQLKRSFQELRAKAKGIGWTEEEMVRQLEPLAEDLERQSQSRLAEKMSDDPWAGFITWEEARAAQSAGVQFGSHTVDHVALATADRDTICDQLGRSKQTLERELGTKCRSIAYPYGSVNSTVTELTHTCGYTVAVTTEIGTNPPGTDPIALRRIHIPVQGSETEIVAVVSGLYPALWRAKELIGAWLHRLSGANGVAESSSPAEL